MLNIIPNKQKKAWLIAGGAFLLVLGCAGVVWVDWNKIKDEQLKADGLQSQIEKADARIRKIPDHENRVLRERAIVKERTKILPDDKDVNAFVSKITEFATASGVEISQLDDKSAQSRGARKTTETFVKIVYKMNLRGTVAQFLDFMNRFESHDRFVSVNQFQIKTDKSGSEKETGPKRHAVDLELETYVYNARAGDEQPVEIIGADQKLAKLLRTEDFDDSLDMEHYEYVPRPERRDPFADPRIDESVSATNANAESTEAQELRLAEFIAEFAKVKTALDEEKAIEDMVVRMEFTKRLNTSLVDLEARVAKVEKEKYFSVDEVKSVFERDVAHPLALVMKERPQASQGFRSHEIEAQFVRMKLAFTERRYQEVVNSGTAILSGRAGMTDPVLAALCTEVETLKNRAEAHLEFNGKPLRFSGVVYLRDNPMTSVVIINERAYSPGDVMDDGVVVARVDPAAVTFLFKKEEIARPFE